jgi:hypothetical protein
MLACLPTVDVHCAKPPCACLLCSLLQLSFATAAPWGVVLLLSLGLIESYRLAALWDEEDFEKRTYPGVWLSGQTWPCCWIHMHIWYDRWCTCLLQAAGSLSVLHVALSSGSRQHSTVSATRCHTIICQSHDSVAAAAAAAFAALMLLV